jgi:Carboxypeptidase regulatory-like domain
MKLRKLGLAMLGTAGLGVLSACQKGEAPATPSTPAGPAVPTAQKAAAPEAPAAPAPAAPAPAAETPVTARGSIRGAVKFNGPPPALAEIPPSADPACAGMPTQNQAVRVKDGRLQNVLVRVRGSVPGTPAAPSSPVVVDQLKCSYHPRVQGAVAGQPLLIKNSDGTLHNVRGVVGSKPIFNVAQPPAAAPVKKDVPAGAEWLRLKCDVHPWMAAYVAVSPHPYFATTGEDGAFSLEGVPVGTYTLEAWHETFGTKTAEVTVKEGAAAEVSFEFSAADKGA